MIRNIWLIILYVLIIAPPAFSQVFPKNPGSNNSDHCTYNNKSTWEFDPNGCECTSVSNKNNENWWSGTPLKYLSRNAKYSHGFDGFENHCSGKNAGDSGAVGECSIDGTTKCESARFCNECNKNAPPTMRYCNGKCNQCFTNKDCPSNRCRETFYGSKRKLCVSCQHVAGHGPHKITLIFGSGGNPPLSQSAKEALARVITHGPQPFRYIQEHKRKFTVQIASTIIPGLGRYNGWSRPIEWKSYQDGDGLKELTPQSISDITQAAKTACPKTSTVVFVGEMWDGGDSAGVSYWVDTAHGFSKKYFIAVNGAAGQKTLAHEYGHIFCKLGGEYVGDSLFGINYEPNKQLNPQTYQWECPRFDGYGIPRPNCFLPRGEAYPAFSSRYGIMDTLTANSGRFNLVSCMGCMNKLGGYGLDESRDICLGFGPAIYRPWAGDP